MSQFLTDHYDIGAWLKANHIGKFKINADNSVDVYEDVNLAGFNLDSLTVQFGTVNGFFNCSGNQLTTLSGCPRIVHGSFYCTGNKLSSFDILPEQVDGWFSFGGGATLNGGLLGLLMIKNVAKFMGPREIVKILNKHLEDKDVFACQQELIEKGFEEYARL